MHLEPAELGRQALVRVVAGLALLLEDLVEHGRTLAGREAVGDGGGLAAQDHLRGLGGGVGLVLLLLVFLHSVGGGGVGSDCWFSGRFTQFTIRYTILGSRFDIITMFGTKVG